MLDVEDPVIVDNEDQPPMEAEEEEEEEGEDDEEEKGEDEEKDVPESRFLAEEGDTTVVLNHKLSLAVAEIRRLKVRNQRGRNLFFGEGGALPFRSYLFLF